MARRARLLRTVVLPAGLLGAAALLLQWLDHRHALGSLSTEAHVVLLAIGFTILGAWLGSRLTRRSAPPAVFEPNRPALEALGISQREHEVLGLLAEGLSNAQIASRLFVSPNTVKTHLGRLYEKLEVSRRTQAVAKARALRLVP